MLCYCNLFIPLHSSLQQHVISGHQVETKCEENLKVDLNCIFGPFLGRAAFKTSVMEVALKRFVCLCVGTLIRLHSHIYGMYLLSSSE